MADNPTHCLDCIHCEQPKPQFSHWVSQCEYACNAGRILKQITSIEPDLSEVTHMVCAIDKSGTFAQYSHTAARKNIRCVGAEYLAADFTCQPCKVSTPPFSQLNDTWQWSLASCKWECHSDRLLYIDIVGAKHCLTWQAFQSSILRRSSAFNVRFTPIQHVIPRLAMPEIFVCMMVLTICVCLQMWL